MIHSSGTSGGTGGVIILVSKAKFSDVVVSTSSVIDGRCTVTSFTQGDRTSKVWNVHNFGLTAGQVAYVANLMHQDIDQALAHPFEMFVWIGGDFNIQSPDQSVRSYDQPQSSATLGMTGRAGFTSFEAVFGKLLEYQQTLGTHYCAATDKRFSLD